MITVATISDQLMGVGRWQDGEPRVAGDEPARLDTLARPDRPPL